MRDHAMLLAENGCCGRCCTNQILAFVKFITNHISGTYLGLAHCFFLLAALILLVYVPPSAALVRDARRGCPQAK